MFALLPVHQAPFLPLDLSGVLLFVGVLISSHALPGDVSQLACSFSFQGSVFSVLGSVPITGLIVQLLPCDFLIKFDRFLWFCLSILIGTIFLLSLTVRTHVLTFNQVVHQGVHRRKNNLFIFL